VVARIKGGRDLPAAWPEFYRQATASSEPHLVKTHGPPVDNQPALYVLRDGRAATCSYWHFHRVVHPESSRTMTDLICGRDYFGDWSSHWHSWQRRSAGARTLVVRYEDLVSADAALLARIAEFCGITKPPKPWANPFSELHAASPQLHRRGSIHWDPPEEWTPLSDYLFAWAHGPLMMQHGYWTQAEMDAARSRLPTSQDDASFLTRLPSDYARMVEAKLV
jgi:hypothetical protein